MDPLLPNSAGRECWATENRPPHSATPSQKTAPIRLKCLSQQWLKDTDHTSSLTEVWCPFCTEAPKTAQPKTGLKVKPPQHRKELDSPLPLWLAMLGLMQPRTQLAPLAARTHILAYSYSSCHQSKSSRSPSTGLLSIS